MITFDIETKDPGLKGKFGDGSIRKDGEVLTICAYDGEKVYYTDKDSPGDERKILNMLASDEVKAGHNVIYDMTWLVHGLGVTVNGRIEDTMTREGLISEFYDRYDLDSCCKRRKVEGKNFSDTVDGWYKEHIGKGKAIENLDKVPWDKRVHYCGQDVKATYNLFKAQEQPMKQNKLEGVNDLECGLIPLLLEMKRNGIRIDGAAREELALRYRAEVEAGVKRVKDEYGLENINSPKQKAAMFHRLGITSSRLTDKGAESFDANFLEECEHPAAALLLEVSRKNTALSRFLDGSLKTHVVGERIHTTFTPTLRDDGGTITGRIGSSGPNLQQIPSKGSRGGKEIRALFLPEEGCVLGAFDYKQIEYCLFAHYAVGPGSEQVRAAITGGKDYHQVAQELLGWHGEDGRKIVKTFNFGVLYGLGLNGFRKKFKAMFNSAAVEAGMSFDAYTRKVMNEYFRNMPFVKPSCTAIKATASKRGWVRSLGGRVHHVPPDKKIYKVVNYLVQGSAADVLKLGMLKAWKAGVFNELKIHLTVHDELVFSIPLTEAGIEAASELGRCMLTDLKLKVPIRVDEETGPHWAACTGEHWEETKRVYGKFQ
jgi:DNA polymerase-1